MASTSQSKPNGVSSPSAAGPSQSASQPTQNTGASGSQTVQNTQATGASSGAAGTGGGGSSSNNNTQAGAGASQPSASSPTPSHAPRPRDARTIELLLTSQGVTSFDQRVPLLLLDFAYRHASSVLSDAIHMATDPYTSHAGGRPSASAGAAPTAPGATDAVVTTNAINLAIASRQSFQFRGRGASKDWLQEIARERNKVALPHVLSNEWGVRLPNERFVLSGVGWGLRDHWEGEAGDDSDEDEDMEGDPSAQKKNADNATGATGEGPQEGERGLDELLNDDIGDEDMADME
ncbi:TFIID-31kDa-domain-containing protein [Jackrogersella minutella]|nr:TFIID-31kDa-domain-containing protein [Jackrogersella minutella]